MAVTYNSVIQKLNAFTLTNAANRADAEAKVEEFMNEIRPEIDEVLRKNKVNPVLTAEEKRAFDEKEARIFNEVTTQFPVPGAVGGRRLRRGKTRAAKLRKHKQKKTRSHKKGTRKH
jgi:hypothetical protein